MPNLRPSPWRRDSMKLAPDKPDAVQSASMCSSSPYPSRIPGGGGTSSPSKNKAKVFSMWCARSAASGKQATVPSQAAHLDDPLALLEVGDERHVRHRVGGETRGCGGASPSRPAPRCRKRQCDARGGQRNRTTGATNKFNGPEQPCCNSSPRSRKAVQRPVSPARHHRRRER